MNVAFEVGRTSVAEAGSIASSVLSKLTAAQRSEHTQVMPTASQSCERLRRNAHGRFRFGSVRQPQDNRAATSRQPQDNLKATSGQPRVGHGNRRAAWSTGAATNERVLWAARSSSSARTRVDQLLPAACCRAECRRRRLRLRSRLRRGLCRSKFARPFAPLLGGAAADFLRQRCEQRNKHTKPTE